MSETLIISASPSETSRTLRLAQYVGNRLSDAGLKWSLLEVRKLPAEDLLHARSAAPQIAEALLRVAASKSIVIASPIYKAAYCGLLKVFVDLFPQFGLRGKVIFPLATGGSPAHVLAIDYALRPMLNSMDPFQIVSGLFVVDNQIETSSTGEVKLAAEVSTRLDSALANFIAAHRFALSGLHESSVK